MKKYRSSQWLHLVGSKSRFVAKRIVGASLRIVASMACVSFLLILPSSARTENYPYRSDFLWVTTPDHSDWLYKSGEEAKVEVSLMEYGVPQDAKVSYEISQDMLPAYKKGTVTLRNGKAVINMGTMKKPGFKTFPSLPPSMARRLSTISRWVSMLTRYNPTRRCPVTSRTSGRRPSTRCARHPCNTPANWLRNCAPTR